MWARLKERLRPEFGIRKRMRLDMIVVGTMFAITIFLPNVIGKVNCMTSSMAVVMVFVSTMGDYTLEPVKNIFKLLAGTTGSILISLLAYMIFPQGTAGYTVMMTAVTFVAFFVIIYIFTSELRGNFFMPLLLYFSMMIYSPAYGTDLIWRFALNIITIGVIIFFQITLYGRKFRRQVRAELDGIIEDIKMLSMSIITMDSKSNLLKETAAVKGRITALRGKIGPKLAQVKGWQHGHDVMRVLHIMGRVNFTLCEDVIKKDKTISRREYNMLLELLDAIDRFENDKIDENEVIKSLDNLIVALGEGKLDEVATSIKADAMEFVHDEVKHEHEERSDWLQRIIDNFNVHKAIFALKTAIIAAGGVFITTFFGMENASMYVMTVSVLAQPYTEIGKQKIKLRIVHTIYALAMYIIAFSASDNVIVSIILLLAMIFIGDMFVKFETNVIGSTMMMVVIRTVNDPGIMWNITFYRIMYVVGAAVIVLLVDMMIPNYLPQSLKRRMKDSAAATEKFKQVAITDQTADIDTLERLIVEKRRANQRVLHINQMLRNKDVSAYLVVDEQWINGASMLLQRMRVNNYTKDQLHGLLDDATSKDYDASKIDFSVIMVINNIVNDMNEADRLRAIACA